ncbi:MAG: mechanosensitive ion channel [Alphaproteobacteria bacterium]|nr:mechanosensitive ion channel [Alphaproteobacteria bacterium]MDE2629993.1 mechanosensitive ion channel [Alphaproteobacteria bacterium]
MQSFVQIWGLDRLLPIVPGTFLSWIETPIFLSQFGMIAASGAIAFWLGTRARPQLTKLALHSLPRSWAATFVRVAVSVAPPLIWLLALWSAAVIAKLAGVALPLVNAGIALLVAWVFIRLLSFFVRSPLASATISVVAWSIAALSILGLLDPLVRQLDASAIRVGTYRLSALTAFNALFALAALLWLTTILFRFLHRQIARAESLTPSLQVLLVQLLQIFLPALAVVIALATAGIDLTALTVVFGAVGLGVGLGLQRLVSNLVAGLTLLAGKTIKPGDIIEYKNSYGWVTAMGARYVTLRTRDGVEHLVPNDYFLENGVENWSYSDVRLRLHVPVGISYDSDVRQAIALCVDAAKSVQRVLERPEPLCLVNAFGDSSINLEIRVWIEDARNGTHNVKSEVLLAVWDRFKEAGIKFPFPQRDVHIVSGPPAGEAIRP